MMDSTQIRLSISQGIKEHITTPESVSSRPFELAPVPVEIRPLLRAGMRPEQESLYYKDALDIIEAGDDQNNLGLVARIREFARDVTGRTTPEERRREDIGREYRVLAAELNRRGLQYWGGLQLSDGRMVTWDQAFNR